MKIFQIGFNKCGTTSIYSLFKKYCTKKYKCIHWANGDLAITIKNNVINNKTTNILGKYENFNVITDMEHVTSKEVILAHKDYFSNLDECYPESMFILNLRPIENWVKSRLKHRIYQTNIPYSLCYQKYFRLNNIDAVILKWIDDYNNHINNVKKYFENKQDRLLIFDIENDHFDKFKTFFAKKNIYFNTDRLPRHNMTKK